MDRLMPVIKKNFPEKVKDFEFIMKNYDEYYQRVKKEARELEKRYKLKIKEIVVH